MRKYLLYVLKWLISVFYKKEISGIENITAGYKIIYIQDLPDLVEDHIIYIVGEEGFYWMLGFNCPCGCKELVQLNLLEDTEPCWSYKMSGDNEITLMPSIWRINGCKSHFFVKNNEIKWVKD